MLKNCLIALSTVVLALSHATISESAPAKLGEMCGGIAGITCEGDLWCDPTPGMCNGADIAGTCIKVPEVCTMDYNPVCGCDQKTYGNDCDRQSKRAALDKPGECGKPDGK